MQIGFWQIFIIASVFLLNAEVSRAQGKLVGLEEDEFKGSYMEDQVMTYFNPDNDYEGAFLDTEAQKVAAYVVEKSRDLEKVIKQLSVSVMNMSARYPGERSKEYRRRLNPFLNALNSELNRKNNEVTGARWRIAFLAAGGVGILAGTMAFLWFGKEKKPILQKRFKRAACYGLVGCLCGTGLGLAAASFYGTTYSSVDEGRLLLTPPEDEKNKEPLAGSSN